MLMVMILFDRLVGLIAPHDCISCGDEGSVLCEYCRPEVLPGIPERCYRCHAQSRDSRTCSTCRRVSGLSSVWVTTEYDGHAKELIGLLKFGRAIAASKIITKQLDDVLPYLSEDTIVVSVPTASTRVRQRGYDQSALIARHLASLRGLQYVPGLVRMGQSRQVGANRKERLQQLKNAFRVSMRRQNELRDAQILLVDDILTTGATLESAAQVLKKAGAKSVVAAVFAQKQ